MIRLDKIILGQRIRGIVPDQAVTIIQVTVAGDTAEVFYKRDDGQPGMDLLVRKDEEKLSLAQAGSFWDLDADAALLQLAAEAYRINLAYLFDPRLAVHTSLIEPLPHQITAVYGEMLPRQPLRFLLADDPGAGKTVMAGLLIKELIIRGDVQRCLICAPGSLADQWQDELWNKFQLDFDILSRERIDSSRTGNPFLEGDRLIIRLDQVARSDELQKRLAQSDWDLIICDEAHKMSASYFGDELKDTKRFKLGKLLGKVSRHFLLMTATPHNGKEEDFQLFLSLLDEDRFEGRYRPEVTEVDASDLMRRMVKEKLLKFDGKPLFPERRAHTLDYQLSRQEYELYEAVTEYVRQEFNRVDQIQNDGRKRGTVGFALTILQRRLASSPEAIYQSLHRRRARLEGRLVEAQQDQQVAEQIAYGGFDLVQAFYQDDWDELADFPDADFEEIEIEVADSATAARTVAELEIEIETLRRLEQQAGVLRRGEYDRKWAEMAELMQHRLMVTESGERRKLVIFTEHRDTLDYLQRKLATLFGDSEAIVVIHGGVQRKERLVIQDRFRNEPETTILLATDAAGEGINLQRAHLMINYDLPWNPNRLEQRFGRIHRIGQTEVCHLWNLVAGETREGHVYQRLLSKLKVEKAALNGQVFDVLGDLFREVPLRKLLVEAIRYGDRPDVRARLDEAIDNITDQEQTRELLEKHSLVQQVLDTSAIEQVRVEMERATARRLQPYYIKAFFLKSLQLLGGTVHQREPGRYYVSHVPAFIRDKARELGSREQIMQKYERICFDKHDIYKKGKPSAEFICPGHIFLDTLIELIRTRYGDALQAGVVVIDERDPGKQPRALFFLEHQVRDASSDRYGQRRVISREVRFLEITSRSSELDEDISKRSDIQENHISRAGDAPYIDYRPPTKQELELLRVRLDLKLLEEIGLNEAAAGQVKKYAMEHLAPAHLEEVRSRREELIDKTLIAVHQRLTKEINYWDKRATEFKAQERTGKRNAKLNWQQAQLRADMLQERLDRRKRELEAARQISAAPPVIVGRALVVPIGMLLDEVPPEMLHRRITEQIAMLAVMEREIALGHEPRDVSAQKLGYDIESRDVSQGTTRFLEVKGRRGGAKTVEVTHNEILKGLNSSAQYALVLVEVVEGKARAPRYVWKPPFREPGSSEVSIKFDLQDLLRQGRDR